MKVAAFLFFYLNVVAPERSKKREKDDHETLANAALRQSPCGVP